MRTLIDGFNEMLSEIQLRDAELERQRELLEVPVEGAHLNLAAPMKI